MYIQDCLFLSYRIKKIWHLFCLSPHIVSIDDILIKPKTRIKGLTVFNKVIMYNMSVSLIIIGQKHLNSKIRYSFYCLIVPYLLLVIHLNNLIIPFFITNLHCFYFRTFKKMSFSNSTGVWCLKQEPRG